LEQFLPHPYVLSKIYLFPTTKSTSKMLDTNQFFFKINFTTRYQQIPSPCRVLWVNWIQVSTATYCAPKDHTKSLHGSTRAISTGLTMLYSECFKILHTHVSQSLGPFGWIERKLEESKLRKSMNEFRLKINPNSFIDFRNLLSPTFFPSKQTDS
jgi:hypothetical protein